MLFTQAHKPSATASQTAFRFKSCGIFSLEQWPVLSPLDAGRFWSCCSWKSCKHYTKNQFREGCSAALLPSNRRITKTVRYQIQQLDLYVGEPAATLFITTVLLPGTPQNWLPEVWSVNAVFSGHLESLQHAVGLRSSLQVWEVASSTAHVSSSRRENACFCCTNTTLWRPEDRRRNQSIVISLPFFFFFFL